MNLDIEKGKSKMADDLMVGFMMVRKDEYVTRG